MKKLLLLLLVIFSITMTSCKEDYSDVPPSMIIKAVYQDGTPYPNASVDLYDSRRNYDNQTAPVVTGQTDRNGIMEIVDLFDIVYYFEVYDNKYGYDNFYEGGVFSTVKRLEYGSIDLYTVTLLPK